MQPPVSITSGGRPVIVDLSLDDDSLLASLPGDVRRELDGMVETAVADRALGAHDADVLDRFAHDLSVEPHGFEHGATWAVLAAAWLRTRAAVLRAGQRPSLYVHADG